MKSDQKPAKRMLNDEGFVFRKKKREESPPPEQQPAAPGPLSAADVADAEEDRRQQVADAARDCCRAEIEGLRELAKAVPTADTRLVLESAEELQQAFRNRTQAILVTGLDPASLDAPLASLGDGERRKRALRTILGRFREEEGEWLKVLDAQRALRSAHEAGRAELEAQLARSGEEAAEEAAQGSAPGVLKGAMTDTHRKMCFQVDSLLAMVSGVEDLVERAERACAMVHREYQQERFRPFQHVESPFVLIRALARARPKP